MADFARHYRTAPVGKQNTGRPVLAGPITTAGGVLFIASTDDNRFRAFDSRTGKELWTTTIGRRGNANPITYGSQWQQYVAIVATALSGYSRCREGVRQPVLRLAQDLDDGAAVGEREPRE